jgi:hypothetical protein
LTTPRIGHRSRDDHDDNEYDEGEKEEEDDRFANGGDNTAPRPPMSSSSPHQSMSSSSCLLSRKALAMSGYYGGDDRDGERGGEVVVDDDDDVSRNPMGGGGRRRRHRDTPLHSDRAHAHSNIMTIDRDDNGLVQHRLSSIPPPLLKDDMMTMNDDDGGVIVGGGGKKRNIIDTEKQPRLLLSPVLSSLFLSSIREEEGENDDRDEDDTDIDPNDPRRHHRVMHAVVDTTMQVMDYLEDEIDTNTWNKLDDFVPMQLRLAIEDQVFGWDHFLSSILGHVGYTLGSYVATYWLVTFVVLRRVPRIDGGGGGGDDYDENVGDLRPWGMPYELFVFLRTVLSIGFAISTFRTIRRRRRVWLPRHTASSSSSTTDAERYPFHEADRQSRRFVLGIELWNKMRRSYSKRRDRMLAQNVRRRLERAERLFEHRGRRMRRRDGGDRAGGIMRSISASSLMSLLSNDEDDDDAVDRDVADDDGRRIGGGSVGGGVRGEGSRGAIRRKRQRRQRLRHEYESAHHERVRVLGGMGVVSPSGSGEGARKRLHSDSSSRGAVDDGCGEDETDDSMGGGSSIGDGDGQSHRGRTRGDRFQMLDSHTLPNFAMESVCHDQMPFAYGKIKKVPYVHGVSFFLFLSLIYCTVNGLRSLTTFPRHANNCNRDSSALLPSC